MSFIVGHTDHAIARIHENNAWPESPDLLRLHQPRSSAVLTYHPAVSFTGNGI